MKAKPSRRIALVAAGRVGALVVGIHVGRVLEHGGSTELEFIQTARAAQGREQARVEDNPPRGRMPVAIVDGQYPASYFPNTELLGADEMRITALDR